MFILRVTFMSIPKDLDEAALIDGAGFWRIFWSVNLPLADTGAGNRRHIVVLEQLE